MSANYAYKLIRPKIYNLQPPGFYIYSRYRIEIKHTYPMSVGRMVGIIGPLFSASHTFGQVSVITPSFRPKLVAADGTLECAMDVLRTSGF